MAEFDWDFPPSPGASRHPLPEGEGLDRGFSPG